jgi:malate dehydrogenase (oxaloacetate-decarboxylating)(NADP+)
MSGQAAAVLACILAALPRMGGRLADHTFLFSGASVVLACISQLLLLHIQAPVPLAWTAIDCHLTEICVAAMGVLQERAATWQPLQSSLQPPLRNRATRYDLTSMKGVAALRSSTAPSADTVQTVLDARRRIWLVDHHGLVTR